MAKKKAYSTLKHSRRMYVFSPRYLIFFVHFLIIFTGFRSFAQGEPEYDEISVFIDVPRLGGGEISAVIKGEEIYLPVTDLFDFLKIRNIPSPGLDTISGFFINQEAPYLIDRLKNSIQLGEKIFDLDAGALIRTETNLYLRGDYFGKIFGLDCIFSFRNLSVVINTRLDLPVIREMRQEEMRQNMTRLKGEVKADTTIGRSYPMFHFGMADWSAIATEQINGPAETRLNLALGSIIAGGETTVSINYNTRDPFTEKQQFYLWRYVNNDNRALRQVMAGKIATRAISSIYNPVVGVQFTNTPTTFRRSFGSYTLSDKTEPGWIVELYVNNILVDYVKADASGFFTFEVPLVYGNSLVMLKFYGPWGEERTREQNIIIPFNFLPKNTLEYTVSAGIVEDSLSSRFSRTSFNYGLTRGVTVGAGFEYLSSVSSGALMPYVNASLRLVSNLLLSGEYTHTVRAKGTLSYRLPSNIQFDINYTKYARDQKAINYNYLEERKIAVSMPIRLKNFSVYNRLSVNQLVLPTTNYTTGEWMLSGSLMGVSTNLTTYALYIGNSAPYAYSNLSLSFRFPSNFTVIPQAQYSYTDKKFISAKLGLEKRLLKHGFLNLSYEQNFRSNLRMGEVGFRYDFKFAQAGFSTRQTDKLTTLIQYARGSLINDRQTNYLGTDNRTNVGKGGISIIPYLDINNNGKRDPGEPKAYGLNLHASGGRIERSEKDTIIRILNLEPYTDCFIELDQSSLDNIAWRLKNRTMRVAVDPNKLKLIEIPVTVIGEASGTVMVEKRGETTGLARMIVNFYSVDQRLAGRVLTEEDGYFSFLGLASGAYNVRIDSVQLRKLEMLSSPDSINFEITANIDGDFVDGLDFTLKMKYPDTTVIIPVPAEVIIPVPAGKPGVKRDTSYFIIHEATEELLTISEDSWAIQLGAFQRRLYAEGYRSKIEALTGRKSEIVVEGGYYKVRILDLKDRKEVDDNIELLRKNGVTVLWVIRLKAKQQQLIITEKLDTLLRIRETIPGQPTPIPFSPDMAIQVGAFRNEPYALALRDKLIFALDKKVTIVHEDGYYKVRVSGFTSVNEMEKFLPALGLLGIRDIWILPVRMQPVEKPPVVEEKKEVPDTATKRFEQAKEVPIEVPPDTSRKPVEEKAGKAAIPPEPTISLQVALFQRRSQALRAQKRIMSKLDLPVEIVQQWDFYKVIVTGFYTREETYKYYPELAGIGYPNITLIEEK